MRMRKTLSSLILLLRLRLVFTSLRHNEDQPNKNNLHVSNAMERRVQEVSFMKECLSFFRGKMLTSLFYQTLFKDLDPPFWVHHGNCMEGELSDIENGQSVSITDDGNLILSGSYYSVTLHKYNVIEDVWELEMDFAPVMDDRGKGPFTAVISNNGKVVAIGSPMNSMQGFDTGAVQFFQKDEIEGTWIEMGDKVTGEEQGDIFGHALDLSDDGLTAVVGAWGADYIKIFEYEERLLTWTFKGFLNGNPGEGFGYAVACSGNAHRMVIGAPFAFNRKGYARIYDIDQYTFGNQIIGDRPGGNYGASVGMSKDGNISVMGAPSVGEVWVSRFNSYYNNWKPLGSRIALPGEGLGSSIAVSGDGLKLAVGAPLNDIFGFFSGHAYMFEYVETDPFNGFWQELGEDKKFFGTNKFELCGHAVDMSYDAKRVVVACPGADAGLTDEGKVCVYRGPGPQSPSQAPSTPPTIVPTLISSSMPSSTPTKKPTKSPTAPPTPRPTLAPKLRVPPSTPSSSPSLTSSMSPSQATTNTPSITSVAVFAKTEEEKSTFLQRLVRFIWFKF